MPKGYAVVGGGIDHDKQFWKASLTNPTTTTSAANLGHTLAANLDLTP